MKRLILLLCLFALVAPLSFARKKPTEPKVFPEVRPDKALVYVCRRLCGMAVMVDDAALGELAWEGECSFDYVDPGTHYLWTPLSRKVDPLVINVFEWDFEPGRTYYFTVSRVTTITWGNKTISSFELLDERAGVGVTAAAKRFNREMSPKIAKEIEKLVAEQDLSKVNNPLIASRRLEQGIAWGKTAESQRGVAAVQQYEKAVDLLENAAGRFDELAKVARQRKINATVGNILGPMLATASAMMQADMSKVPAGGDVGHQVGVGTAFYSITETKSLKELIGKYERLADQARMTEGEYRRRLACHAGSTDDAAIDRCIGEAGGQ